MITIPNQSSVAKAFLEFDDAGRMKPSAFYERVVDMEESVKFTLLTRDVAPYLVDRYSERRERRGNVETRQSAVHLSTIASVVLALVRATQPFRHLSPSIAPKRKFLAVDLTVSSL